jgi:hypothetical protein
LREAEYRLGRAVPEHDVAVGIHHEHGHVGKDRRKGLECRMAARLIEPCIEG